MRQRVAVGRAFAAPASLLLMDEPFGALDRFTREELQSTLNRLYMSQPHMVVFVTHDVEEALFLCDRICLLSSRPGTVREVIKVPFPRPRRLKVKREQRFIELKYEIEDKLRRHMIRGEK
jgi:ABC-type nitrate/sulfonate/bicarbonate transport system ATPase subunit